MLDYIEPVLRFGAAYSGVEYQFQPHKLFSERPKIHLRNHEASQDQRRLNI
jgi:hypothetical protein